MDLDVNDLSLDEVEARLATFSGHGHELSDADHERINQLLERWEILKLEEQAKLSCPSRWRYQ